MGYIDRRVCAGEECFRCFVRLNSAGRAEPFFAPFHFLFGGRNGRRTLLRRLESTRGAEPNMKAAIPKRKIVSGEEKG